MSVIAITYPLSLPTVPAPTNTEINLDYAVGFARAPTSFKGQSQDWLGRMWRAKITLAVMKRNRADAWLVFFSLLHGRVGSFLLGDWDRRTPRGTIAGTVLVNGAGQTGNGVAVDGATAGTTLLAGDHISIENRLYRVVTNVTFDVGSGGGSIATVVTRGYGSFGSISAVVTRGYGGAGGAGGGEGTIQIEPDLRSAPADNAVVTYINPKGLFRLAQNYVPSPSDFNGVHSLAFDAEEYL